jgi:hypothetical protein
MTFGREKAQNAQEVDYYFAPRGQSAIRNPQSAIRLSAI